MRKHIYLVLSALALMNLVFFIIGFLFGDFYGNY